MSLEDYDKDSSIVWVISNHDLNKVGEPANFVAALPPFLQNVRGKAWKVAVQQASFTSPFVNGDGPMTLTFQSGESKMVELSLIQACYTDGLKVALALQKTVKKR